jgi:lipoate-protein ligase A
MQPKIACRVFPHESADGPANMARDEAMLDLVAGDPTAAAFRTYTWIEPTLSLGYFQSISEAEADARWRSVPLVRRPTGGGAIWHHHEITYALVIPRGHPLARRSAELYRVVHAAICGLLAIAGVVASRRGDAEAPAGSGRRPFLCFTDRDAEDLVIAGHKVVGSAQRRRSGAVLQHGSLLLARSSLTPELPGLNELTSAPSAPSFWAQRLALRVPEALGLWPEPAGWPEGFLDRARDLERTVYGDPGWTRRR